MSKFGSLMSLFCASPHEAAAVVGHRVQYRGYIGVPVNGCKNVEHGHRGTVAEYPTGDGNRCKIGVDWDKGGRSDVLLWELDVIG